MRIPKLELVAAGLRLPVPSRVTVPVPVDETTPALRIAMPRLSEPVPVATPVMESGALTVVVVEALI